MVELLNRNDWGCLGLWLASMFQGFRDVRSQNGVIYTFARMAIHGAGSETFEKPPVLSH